MNHLIACSKQYADDHPEAERFYWDGKALFPYRLGKEVPANAEFRIEAKVPEETLTEFHSLQDQLTAITARIDEIKAAFAEDADAYNSVGGATAPYSLTFGKDTMYVKETTTVAVTDGSNLSKLGVSNLVVPKEITYTLGKEWKSVIVAIATDEYGDKSSTEELELINKELGGSSSTLETLRKKLGKTEETNAKRLAAIYDIDISTARKYAERIARALIYDRVEVLASLSGRDIPTLVRSIKCFTSANTNQTVAFTTSTV